jgi:hypothetical protein
MQVHHQSWKWYKWSFHACVRTCFVMFRTVQWDWNGYLHAFSLQTCLCIYPLSILSQAHLRVETDWTDSRACLCVSGRQTKSRLLPGVSSGTIHLPTYLNLWGRTALKSWSYFLCATTLNDIHQSHGHGHGYRLCLLKLRFCLSLKCFYNYSYSQIYSQSYFGDRDYDQTLISMPQKLYEPWLKHDFTGTSWTPRSACRWAL